MRRDILSILEAIGLLQERIAAFPLFRSAEHPLHTARLAKPPELRILRGDLPQTETSLLLGVDQHRRTLRLIPSDTSPELGNMLVAGPPRSGKSLLLTTQLKTWPHSVIVNDIKGELSDQTAEERAKDGKVFFLDPRGVGNTYDPLLRRMTEDELRSSAEKLLFEPGEGERGTVFSQRAAKMLTQMFRAARIENQRPIPYAAYLLHIGPVDTAIRLDAVSRRAGLPPDKNLANRFLDVRFEHANFNDPFFQSAWSTLTTRMDPVISETAIESIAGSDFTPQEIIAGDKPVTVYLRFPELHLHALAPLIRLVWSSLIEELNNVYDEYKRERKEKLCRPVLLAIDEAGRAPVPGLPEYSSTVAGRRITLWIAVQSLTQLDAVYGTKRGDASGKHLHPGVFQTGGRLHSRAFGEKALLHLSIRAF